VAAERFGCLRNYAESINWIGEVSNNNFDLGPISGKSFAS